MARFLSEMEKVASEKKLKKAEIAKAIGTSPSFITQLYRGDKLINLTTLAKLQAAYDFTFEVRAKENSSNYQEEVEALSRNVQFSPPHSRPALWISGHKPDYAQSDIIDFAGKLNKTKIA
jgi:transcriptional regulator with XRE-family HTH domain